MKIPNFRKMQPTTNDMLNMSYGEAMSRFLMFILGLVRISRLVESRRIFWMLQ